MSIMIKVLDNQLDQLATWLENMMTEKLKKMEIKLKGVKKEMEELKEDFNDSLNHVENILREARTNSTQGKLTSESLE